jgi:adenylyltransferase/sulfurtransferase
VLPGTIGTLQAAEVIKLILGIGIPLISRLLLYDALEGSFQTIQLHKNPGCVVCGEHPTITHLIDYEQFCGTPVHRPSEIAPQAWDIEPRQLAERLKGGEKICLVDVREAVEQQVSTLPGALHIPYGHLSSRLCELSKDDEIVVFCRTGSRSTYAVQLLHSQGFTKAKNAWAREIDKMMLEY